MSKAERQYTKNGVKVTKSVLKVLPNNIPNTYCYIVWARLGKDGGTVTKSILRSESAAQIISQISQIRPELLCLLRSAKTIIWFKPSLSVHWQYTDGGTVTECCQITFWISQFAATSAGATLSAPLATTIFDFIYAFSLGVRSPWDNRTVKHGNLQERTPLGLFCQ